MLCKTKKPKQTKEQNKKQQQQKKKKKKSCSTFLLAYIGDIRKIRNEGGNLLKYIPNAHTSTMLA